LMWKKIGISIIVVGIDCDALAAVAAAAVWLRWLASEH